MKKLLALVPFFAFAACGNVDINLGKLAGAAGTGGAGGSAGNGVGANGNGGTGNSDPGQCCSGESDGARLNRLFMVGEDGSRMHTDYWRDNALNTDCRFQKLPNGETRCVPDHAVVNTFLDSACTMPVYFKKRCAMDGSPLCKVEYPNLDCVTPDEFVRIDNMVPDPMCTGECTGFSIYRVDHGNQIQGIGNVYEHEKDGSCGFVGTPSSWWDWAAYGIFKIGDADDFVRATHGPGF